MEQWVALHEVKHIAEQECQQGQTEPREARPEGVGQLVHPEVHACYMKQKQEQAKEREIVGDDRQDATARSPTKRPDRGETRADREQDGGGQDEQEDRQRQSDRPAKDDHDDG